MNTEQYVGKIQTCGMRNVKCVMQNVETCGRTVGKMCNAEICRMSAIVLSWKGTVYLHEWVSVGRELLGLVVLYL